MIANEVILIKQGEWIAFPVQRLNNERSKMLSNFVSRQLNHQKICCQCNGQSKETKLI